MKSKNRGDWSDDWIKANHPGVYESHRRDWSVGPCGPAGSGQESLYWPKDYYSFSTTPKTKKGEARLRQDLPLHVGSWHIDKHSPFVPFNDQRVHPEDGHDSPMGFVQDERDGRGYTDYSGVLGYGANQLPPERQPRKNYRPKKKHDPLKARAAARLALTVEYFLWRARRAGWSTHGRFGTSELKAWMTFCTDAYADLMPQRGGAADSPVKATASWLGSVLVIYDSLGWTPDMLEYASHRKQQTVSGLINKHRLLNPAPVVTSRSSRADGHAETTSLVAMGAVNGRGVMNPALASLSCRCARPPRDDTTSVYNGTTYRISPTWTDERKLERCSRCYRLTNGEPLDHTAGSSLGTHRAEARPHRHAAAVHSST
jgi:hypothetical protein